jgi:TetR/AcrR family transcriptional regulator, transcriptional repressor for nem operon
MGRHRSFDEALVVEQAAACFLRSGYEGTSVEELTSATGLHRGSLYQAFGSKRGLFLAGLRAALAERPDEGATTDLVLVSLLELAPRDREVRDLLASHLTTHRITDHDLGARLLERAGIHLGED